MVDKSTLCEYWPFPFVMTKSLSSVCRSVTIKYTISQMFDDEFALLQVMAGTKQSSAEVRTLREPMFYDATRCYWGPIG